MIETRANVDVISGTLTTRTGGQDEIIAAIEDSGRAGGASPAELLGILALRTDPTLTHVTRSTRHSFDDTARAYADRVASIPGSRVFWSGIDHGFDGKFVFIGVF